MTATPAPPVTNRAIREALKARDLTGLQVALANGEDANALIPFWPYGVRNTPPQEAFHPMQYLITWMHQEGASELALAMMDTMLMHGSDPDAGTGRISYGNGPLANAVRHGLPEAARRLLAHGAQVNRAAGAMEHTPMHLVGQSTGSSEDLIALVRVLQEAGGSLDALNGAGHTPLMTAVRATRGAAIRAFLTVRPLSLTEGERLCHDLAQATYRLGIFGLDDGADPVGMCSALTEAFIPLVRSDAAFRTLAMDALEQVVVRVRERGRATDTAWSEALGCIEAFLSEERLRETVALPPPETAPARPRM